MLLVTPSEIRELASSFRRFREKHLLTQKALAEAMGISRREVQYVERRHEKRRLSRPPDVSCPAVALQGSLGQRRTLGVTPAASLRAHHVELSSPLR